MTPPADRVSVTTLAAMKAAGRKIVMTTAYNALFAALVDKSGIDVILVGDSVGPVLAGETSTVPVTLRQMAYHGRSVVRGTRRALVVVDMPFLSYQVSPRDAVRNAGLIMKRTGAGAVKLEGGQTVAPAVRALVDAGIPVMGHVGFTPQSQNVFGGISVQGRGDAQAERLLQDARAVEAAGAFAVVLEFVSAAVAERVTAQLSIPTIGIGAGIHCDGQVLVLYDLLGLNPGFHAKFVKHYGELATEVTRALEAFATDVRAAQFPDAAHSHA